MFCLLTSNCSRWLRDSELSSILFVLKSFIWSFNAGVDAAVAVDVAVAVAVDVEVAAIEVDVSIHSINPSERKDKSDEFLSKWGSWSQIPNALNLLKMFNVLNSRRWRHAMHGILRKTNCKKKAIKREPRFERK